MKILFCSDALTIDGVTSYILNTGAALSRAGHKIAVMGRWAGKGFQDRYRQENFTLITCPSISVKNFWFDMRAKSFRPDLIMTDPRRSFPLATRIKAITGAPVITYFLDPVEKTDRPGRDINSLVKYSNVFTSFEDDILRQLREIHSGLPIINMPRPLDIFFAPSELPRKDKFNVLCFGRLSRYKTPGIFYLLDNIETIQARIPDFTINILGGGGWRLYKFQLIAHRINTRLGHKCVNIIGAQDNPREFIERANVIFGSAVSAMESAYSMRPVIAMSGNYFGLVTPENLNDAVKTFFAERYGVYSFSDERAYENILPDLFRVYENYDDKDFVDGLRKISCELGKKFNALNTTKSFYEIARLLDK